MFANSPRYAREWRGTATVAGRIRAIVCVPHASTFADDPLTPSLSAVRWAQVEPMSDPEHKSWDTVQEGKRSGPSEVWQLKNHGRKQNISSYRVGNALAESQRSGCHILHDQCYCRLPLHSTQSRSTLGLLYCIRRLF
jgi:hypothetical protein